MPGPTHRFQNGSSAPIDAEMPRAHIGRRLFCSIAAMGGVVLSLVFFSLLLTRERQFAQEQFHKDAKERIGEIQECLNDRLGVVDSLAAYFSGSQLVEPGEFDSFNAWLLKRHQCVNVLGWAPRIPAAKERLRASRPRPRPFQVPNHRTGQPRELRRRRQSRRVLSDPLHQAVSRESIVSGPRPGV